MRQLAIDLFYVFLYGMNTASLSDVKGSIAIGDFLWLKNRKKPLSK